MLDANTGQNALAQVKAFDDALGLTGLVSPSSTAPRRAASSPPSHAQRPVPIAFIGVGEGIDDLRPFDAGEFVDALVD